MLRGEVSAGATMIGSLMGGIKVAVEWEVINWGLGHGYLDILVYTKGVVTGDCQWFNVEDVMRFKSVSFALNGPLMDKRYLVFSFCERCTYRLVSAERSANE